MLIPWCSGKSLSLKTTPPWVLARLQLQNVYFYKSGILGSFTVKLYQRIDLEYYYSGCNSSQITEVACANGSTSLLALSIPANLEETYTTRPFGSGRCFLPPPKSYWKMRTNLVLRQFWWKVFDKVILENNFSSKTCQFRNKKETREFKRLRFYGSIIFHQNWRRTNFTAMLM